MKNTSLIYKSVKIIEALVLVALGIVICVFSNKEELNSAIGYCVAFVVFIFGLLSILFAFLFSRGMVSSDIIGGSFMIALSVMIFIEPSLVTQFLPTFFGTILIVYAVIMLLNSIKYFIGPKDNKSNCIFRILFIFLTAIFLIVCGSLMIVYSGATSQWINIFIGIIFIIAGAASGVFTILTPRKEVEENLQKINKEENTKKAIETKSVTVVDEDEIEPKNKSVKSKRKSKKKTSTDEIKQIENKEDKSN